MVKNERDLKALDIMAPEQWIKRHIDLVPDGGCVLDLAAGGGRHALLACDLGHAVLAVDRDVSRLRPLSGDRIAVQQCDLEAGEWPHGVSAFTAIIVCNYLWRPLFPRVMSALAPGGLLLWTTFAAGNEQFGRPRNPEYLLGRNELIDAFSGNLDVIAFEDRVFAAPKPAVRQSICARRPAVDREGTGC